MIILINLCIINFMIKRKLILIIKGEMLMSKQELRILLKKVGKEPKIMNIENTLEAKQEIVGGYIECVYLPNDDSVVLICNEEGKLSELPLNRALRGDYGGVYDIIAGTFLIVWLGEEDFCSLSDEYIKKFSDRFKTPEKFAEIDGKIIVIRIENEDGESV